MKKIICAILLLTMSAFMFSCSRGVDTPEGMQLVSTDDVAYRFYVPKTWTINSVDYPSAYLSANDKSNVSVSTTAIDDEIKTLDEYWTYCDTSYKAQLAKYEQVGEAENLLVDEKNAKKCVYTFELDGKNYKAMQTFVGKDGYVYAITYVSLAETYDSNLEAVNKIISVFKFK